MIWGDQFFFSQNNGNQNLEEKKDKRNKQWILPNVMNSKMGFKQTVTQTPKKSEGCTIRQSSTKNTKNLSMPGKQRINNYK